MARFEINKRTMQYELVRTAVMDEKALFQKMKRCFGGRATDEEIVILMNKIKAGTRNMRFLVDSDNRSRLEVVAKTLLDEMPQ